MAGANNSNAQVKSSRLRSVPVRGSELCDNDNSATVRFGPHSVVQCSESSTSSVASPFVLRSEIELQLTSGVGNPISCNEYGAATEAIRSTDMVKQSVLCLATKSQLELLVEGGREEAFTVVQEVCAEHFALTSVETFRSHFDPALNSDSTQVILTSDLRTLTSVSFPTVKSKTSVQHRAAVQSASPRSATRSAKCTFRFGPRSCPDLFNGIQGRRNANSNRIRILPVVAIVCIIGPGRSLLFGHK